MSDTPVASRHRQCHADGSPRDDAYVCRCQSSPIRPFRSPSDDADYGTPPRHSENAVTLDIDGQSVTVPAGTSVMRAAAEAGIHVPKLCATDTLEPYGSCRLCVVEIDGRRGYPASCTTPAENGMTVRTQTDALHRLRRNVMELYLSDHPPECLTCAANGDCELQRMANVTGLREVRYGAGSDGAADGTINRAINRTARTIDRIIGSATDNATDGATDCARETRDGMGHASNSCEYVAGKPAREIRDDTGYAHHLACAKDESNPYFSYDPSKCIVCARCVRACEEIQGAFALAIAQRGFASRVTAGANESFMQSECVSCGACVAACPTAALQEKSVLARGLPEHSIVTTCAYCGVGCALKAEMKGSEVVRMVPFKNGQANEGHACVKGRFAWGYATHRERVVKPMIRAKITDPWREVSWDEALAYAASGLRRIQREHGRDAVGGITSSRCTNEETYLVQKLVRAALGNNNVDTCARVCHAPTGYGLKATLGEAAGTQTFASVRQADVIMVIGANPTDGHPVFGARVKRRVREGAKLIVIDPRRIDLVDAPHVQATYHLQLRPGTNVALLNALAHVIVTEGLVDDAFVAGRCDARAFAQWRAFVARPGHSPEATAGITGIDASLVRAAARLYATGGQFADRPASQTTDWPASQPANQPADQPTNQPASQIANQPTDQPTNQSASQPTDQPASQIANQPADQLADHPTNQPASHPNPARPPHGRSAIYYGLGVTEHAQGSTAVMAIANLAMATGNVGREGVGVNPLRGQNNVQGSCDMGSFPHELPGYRHVSDAHVRALFGNAWQVTLQPEPGLRLPNMFDAALDGSFRGLYCQGEDIVQSDPDTHHVVAALSAMECVIVQDLFLSETAKYAHVFLPGSSFLEKDGTFTNAERRISRVRKVMPPLAGYADWQVTLHLARALGYDMDYAHPGEIMDEIARLTPTFRGVSYARLDELGSIQWPCNEQAPQGTPTMHVDRFSSGPGQFVITEFVASPEKVSARFPLLLTTGRILAQYNAGTQTRRTHNSRWHAEDWLEIHPHDAQERGIRDGDWVSVESRAGHTALRAKVAARMQPGVVYTTFHFPASGTNVVTTNVSDWATNCPEYKVTAVQVRRGAARAVTDKTAARLIDETVAIQPENTSESASENTQEITSETTPEKARADSEKNGKGRETSLPHLIDMANQIGQFFASLPDQGKALDSIADHIHRFWEPRMRRALLATFENDADAWQTNDLSDTVRAALRANRDKLMPVDD